MPPVIERYQYWHSEVDTPCMPPSVTVNCGLCSVCCFMLLLIKSEWLIQEWDRPRHSGGYAPKYPHGCGFTRGAAKG